MRIPRSSREAYERYVMALEANTLAQKALVCMGAALRVHGEMRNAWVIKARELSERSKAISAKLEAEAIL